MRGLIEYKNQVIKAEDVDFKNRIVTSYWSSFGNQDHDKDVILSGAFRKTIQERGPKGTNEIFYLFSHDWQKPLGKPTELMEDSKGLFAEVPVNVGTTYSEDALKLMAAGLLIQNSIGFVTMKETYVKPSGEWDDSTYREISEVKLYEGSAVVLGANPNTPFTGFKNLSLTDMNDQITKITKLLRNGDLTDEGFIRLEIALKQLQKDAFELGKKSLEENKPIRDSLIIDKPTIDIEKAFISYLN
jgi:uncharacterized protein